MGTRRNLKAYEARRLKAVRLFESGYRQTEVAVQTHVSRQAVSQWVRAWRRGGQAALERARPKGRPSKLTPAQRRQLTGLLGQGAASQGFPDDLWSGSRVTRLVRDRFGVVLHPKYAPRLLRVLGCKPPESKKRTDAQHNAGAGR